MTRANTTIKWLISLALTTGSAMLSAQEDAGDSAERKELRQQIQQARAELADAARRMARLQRELGAHAGDGKVVHFHADESADGIRDVSIRLDGSNWFEGGNVTATGMPPRLGVLLGGPGADAANEVIGLTPGGGAEAAGIEQDDRLVSVNGESVVDGAPESIRDALEGVEAGTSVPVVVEREGQQLTFDVETTSVIRDVRVFGLRAAPDAGDVEREIVIMQPNGPQAGEGAGPPGQPFPPRAPLFSVLGQGSDLISNHVGLEHYFGTAEGVVVLRIDPENDFDLRDGDVVLRLDDETIGRPVDLGRLLLVRDPGEQVVFEVMREGVLTQIPATIPERRASINAFPMRFEFKTAPEPPNAPEPPQPL